MSDKKLKAIETIEKEIAAMDDYNDKLEILEKYFGDRVKDKEVING